MKSETKNSVLATGAAWFLAVAFKRTRFQARCSWLPPLFFNWRTAVFYVVSVIVGTLVARATKGIGELLDLNS
jgi:hypothetical protein